MMIDTGLLKPCKLLLITTSYYYYQYYWNVLYVLLVGWDCFWYRT